MPTLLVVLCGLGVILLGVVLFLEVRHTALTRKDIKNGHRRAEAWTTLYHALSPRAPLPVTTPWSASPELLALLCNLIALHKPKHIVELGSGLSTVVCSYALERYSPEGKVSSFDAEARFASQTRNLLALHGHGERATVSHAPLQPLDTPLGNIPWYQNEAFTHAHAIDLLIVDGPPGADQSMARYPALIALAKKLSPGAIIVVDDADRDDERLMISHWKKLIDFEVEHWEVEKGVSVLYTARDAERK